jgi:C-terminal peptidase prc
MASRVTPALLCAALLFISTGANNSVRAQSFGNLQREQGVLMLKNVKNEIKKNYYDPAFRGIDIDARFKAAEEKIRQSTSFNQIFGIIAQALIEFDDSHLFFIPPSRVNRVDYGWQMQAFGDKVLIVSVKPGSDAEAKGLKPGDEVLQVNEYQPVRANMWKLDYLYRTLKPQPGMRLVVRSPEGKPREMVIAASVEYRKQTLNFDEGDFYEIIREQENENRLNRHRYVELGEETFIWKMPNFDLTDQGVDDMMNKIRKRKSLILDLRGNPGGYVSTLERMAGFFFDRDVKIADVKGRKETKPVMAKTRGERAFLGKLVVLIDSKSGSAAEVFARMVQLEKRGTVIGDRSSGAVMQSRGGSLTLGSETVIVYGLSVTNADLLMADGKSIEHVGVTPDEARLPSPSDLAAKRDPVLARAAEIAGVKIDPEKAGSMFPIEWKK